MAKHKLPDLTEKERKILNYSENYRGSTLIEIAKGCGYKDGGYVSRAVQKLAEYGLVETESSRQYKSNITRVYPKDHMPEREKALHDVRLAIESNPNISRERLASLTRYGVGLVNKISDELASKNLIARDSIGKTFTYHKVQDAKLDTETDAESVSRFERLSDGAKKAWEYGIEYQSARKDKKGPVNRYAQLGMINQDLQLGDETEKYLEELYTAGFIKKIDVTIAGRDTEGKRTKAPGKVYMFLPLDFAEHSESEKHYEDFRAIHERNTLREPVDEITLQNGDSGLKRTLVFGAYRAGHKGMPWWFTEMLPGYLQSLDETERPVRAINMGDAVEGEHHLNESQRTILADHPELRDQLRLYKEFVDNILNLPVIQVLTKEERDVIKEYAFKSLGHETAFTAHGIDTGSVSFSVKRKVFTEDVIERMIENREYVLPYMFKTGRLPKTSAEISKSLSETDFLLPVAKELDKNWDDIKSGKIPEADFMSKHASALSVIDYGKLKQIVSGRRELQTELVQGNDLVVGHLDMKEGGVSVRGGYYANAKTNRSSDEAIKTLNSQLSALGDEKYKAADVVLNKGTDRLKIDYDKGILTIVSPGLRNTANFNHADILDQFQQDHAHRAAYLEKEIKRPSVLILSGGGNQPYRFEIINARFLKKIRDAANEKEENHTIALISDVHPGSPTHQAEAFVKYLKLALIDQKADRLYGIGDLVHGRNYPDFVNEGERSSDGGPGKIRIDTQTQLLLGELEPFLRAAPKLELMKLVSGNHEKNSKYRDTGVEYALRELEALGNFIGDENRMSDQFAASQIQTMISSKKELEDLAASLGSNAPDSLKKQIDDLGEKINKSVREGRPYMTAELYTDIYIPRGNNKSPDYVPNAEIFKDVVAGYTIAGQHRWNDGGMAHRPGGGAGGVASMENWIIGNGKYAEPLDILLGGHYHHFHSSEFLDKLLLSLSSFASLSNFELHKGLNSTVGGVILKLSNKIAPVIEFYPRHLLEGKHDDVFDYFGGKDNFDRLVRDPLFYRDKIRKF